MWRELFDEYLATSYNGGDCEFIINEGCDNGQIEYMVSQFKCRQTHELVSIYRDCDGFGVLHEVGYVECFLPASSKLQGVIEKAALWFAETHEDIANRFLPIYDWNDGNFTGYLRGESGTLEDESVYTFYHDMYYHEEGQSWDEFIIYEESSFEKFILRVIEDVLNA